MISNDPVAADVVAWNIVQQKRKETGTDYFITTSLDKWYMSSVTEREKFKSFPNKMKYGGVAGAYVEDCAKAGLGNYDLKNIDLKILE